MTNSLPAVIRMKRWNEIEPAIIARLGGPDLNRARQAAETLAKFGGPKAEKAMWARLRSFHRQWAPRANDLNSRPEMPRGALDAMSFQFGLVEALGRDPGMGPNQRSDHGVGESDAWIRAGQRKALALEFTHRFKHLLAI